MQLLLAIMASLSLHQLSKRFGTGIYFCSLSYKITEHILLQLVAKDVRTLVASSLAFLKIFEDALLKIDDLCSSTPNNIFSSQQLLQSISQNS